MKQFGNLAIVCAGRSDVLLQVRGGDVTVFIGKGSDCSCMSARWDDDEKINAMIHSLNFGATAEKVSR